jgi:hypothetical protein
MKMKKVQAYKTDLPVPEGAQYLSSQVVGNQMQHYFLVEVDVPDSELSDKALVEEILEKEDLIDLDTDGM